MSLKAYVKKKKKKKTRLNHFPAVSPTSKLISIDKSWEMAKESVNSFRPGGLWGCDIARSPHPGLTKQPELCSAELPVQATRYAGFVESLRNVYFLVIVPTMVKLFSCPSLFDCGKF